MCLFKYDIANIFGDGLGENGVEGLGVLDGAIVGINGECVRDVDGGYRLIFGENTAIGFA